MARFFSHMVSENVQVFWGALQRGEFITDAAEAAGTYRKQGTRWVIANGGVRPRRGRNLQERYLSFAEREETALGRAAGESMRSIAGRLGRSPSTISRELGRNAELPGRYRATSAHAQAWGRAARPKTAELVRNLVLRGRVEKYLERSTRRSRSPAGCARSSPRTGRCGCRPRRSISRCMCSRVARYAAS